jgi:hypothetical protein
LPATQQAQQPEGDGNKTQEVVKKIIVGEMDRAGLTLTDFIDK